MGWRSGYKGMTLFRAELTGQIISSAIEVPRELGPGLLESAYRSCLQRELQLRSLRVVAEIGIPIHYKGIEISEGYRADLLVEEEALVELKAIEALLPIHDAQLLTYLRLCKLRVGLMINFNVKALREGIRRRIL